MVTKQEVEKLKPDVWLPDRLVVIQCTKPPDVVKRMAELLAEVGCVREGKQLTGQWVCSVCCCSSVVMCAILNEQLKWIEFYSLAIALSRLYLTDHEAVVVPKPLQVCLPSRAGRSKFTLARQSWEWCMWVICPGDSVKGNVGACPQKDFTEVFLQRFKALFQVLCL